MKKTFCVFASVMLAAVTASAQLKVDAEGKTRIACSLQQTYPMLTVGSSERVQKSSLNTAIAAVPESRDSIHNIGVDGFAATDTSFINNKNVGVRGAVYAKASSGRNVGVAGFALGSASQGKRGAGIYGSTSTLHYLITPAISGLYAGYFEGEVRVTDKLTAKEVYTTSDIRLKENIVSLSGDGSNGSSTLGNILNMNVIEYNLKSSQSEDTTEELDTTETDEIQRETESLNSERKIKESKRHFGLSAQELQKIYPNLVDEGQDGYLAVNYTELVPILIRSIQELKAELDDLKGNADGRQQTEAARRARQATTTGIGDDAAGTATQATLYQNSPNPFTSQTVIRFSLPENAPASYIYIFDMQGKMVKQLPVNASMQSVTINGYELQAGIYLYSLVVGGQEIDTKRMILSK